MKTIPDSLTPTEAWEKLVSCPRMPFELMPVEDAGGHILADDFVATEDVPPAPRSFMDGYALRAEDLIAIPIGLKITGEILMGEKSVVSISKGEAVAVPTGGFLPQGANAVIMQEDTERSGSDLLIKKKVKEGENVQLEAEDFHKGDVIFQPPHCLRPQDISTIATFGLTHVRVYRRPRIRILSTGNELIQHTSKLRQQEKIRETNSLALAFASRHFGFTARRSGIIADDFESQRAALQNAFRDSDVVLVSGGSSVGARDLTMEVIQSFSPHQIYFHGLAIRPGNPTIFGSAGPHWIFGLPGQPVSSLVVFYLFVLPFLFHLSGECVEYSSFPESKFLSRTARLATSVKPLKTKTDYLRLRLLKSREEWIATPVTGKSASLSTLALAHGFTIIPPGEISVAEGATLKVILFP